MKLERILNIIGYVFLVPGPILFFFGLAGLRQGKPLTAWTIAGGIVMVLGLILGNFRGDWLVKEEE